MIKVLHLINGADLGGISTFIVNYYSHMDRNEFKFDFGMYDTTLGVNGKKLKAMGCDFFTLPSKKHFIQYSKMLRKKINEGNYDVIHVHTNTSSYIPLRIAKNEGVKIRVAHAHSAVASPTISYRIKSFMAHVLIPRYATNMCACSELAGIRVFGKNNIDKVEYIPNSIEAIRYKYDVAKREKIRKELRLSMDDQVLGMVGRLSEEKNTKYAIDIIRSLNDKNVKLVIAGDGPLRKVLEKKVLDYGVSKRVMFLGQRTDVPELLSAFDVFLLPSQFEGFPISALEALSSGLPVVLSDTITQEVSFGDRITYLPITDEAIGQWGEIIKEYLLQNYRTDGKEVTKGKYNIDNSVMSLEEIYRSK